MDISTDDSKLIQKKSSTKVIKLIACGLIEVIVLTALLFFAYQYFFVKTKGVINQVYFTTNALRTPAPSTVSLPGKTPQPELTKLQNRKENDKTYSFMGTESVTGMYGGSYIKPTKFGRIDNGKFIAFDDNFNFWIARSVTDQTKDFWYDDDNSKLFTIDTILPQSDEDYEAINIYHFEDHVQLHTVNNIYVGKAGLYSSTRILDYYPQVQTLLLITEGGDGCGGGGGVWTLNENSVRHDIKNFGMGCGVSVEKPVYIGYFKGLIYAGLVQKAENLPIPEEYEITKIISINPLTGFQMTVTEDAEILNKITYAAFPDNFSPPKQGVNESEIILGYDAKSAFDVETKKYRILN
jgi:hypothetical protein